MIILVHVRDRRRSIWVSPLMRSSLTCVRLGSRHPMSYVCRVCSYSGNEWEGIAPSPLHPTCIKKGSSKGCYVKLNDKAFAYRVDAMSRAKKPEAKFDTARFLAQATFGASKRDLKQFESKYTSSTRWSNGSVGMCWHAGFFSVVIRFISCFRLL